MVEGRTEQYLPGFPVSEQTCYGGSDNTDSSGSIQFLEIRHAGAVQDDGYDEVDMFRIYNAALMCLFTLHIHMLTRWFIYDCRMFDLIL